MRCLGLGLGLRLGLGLGLGLGSTTTNPSPSPSPSPSPNPNQTPEAKKACISELLMSSMAHGSGTVVSCFGCTSGPCCSAAVGSTWLSLLVFALWDSGAPRFHFLPVVPPSSLAGP